MAARSTAAGPDRRGRRASRRTAPSASPACAGTEWPARQPGVRRGSNACQDGDRRHVENEHGFAEGDGCRVEERHHDGHVLVSECHTAQHHLQLTCEQRRPPLDLDGAHGVVVHPPRDAVDPAIVKRQEHVHDPFRVAEDRGPRQPFDDLAEVAFGGSCQLCGSVDFHVPEAACSQVAPVVSTTAGRGDVSTQRQKTSGRE
jgi:hypothetical protein